MTTPNEVRAANLYLDSGVSLIEAQTMMDQYIDGERKIAAMSAASSGSRSIDTNTNFYSSTNLSSNQHYGVVIANNGSAVIRTTTLTLEYVSDWISFVGSSPFGETLNPNSTLSDDLDLVGNALTIVGSVPAMESTVTPAAEYEIPFNVVMTSGNSGNESFSEGTLYHKFTFTRDYCKPADANNDTTFCFETYVRGDVNHDGIVDTYDEAYLTNYCLNILTDLSFSYTDKSDNIAAIINKLAADTDKNGYVTVADLTWVSQHIE
ncbi:MAG: dockerin type I domain-containing protein [Porcipelethomonas sp.]